MRWWPFVLRSTHERALDTYTAAMDAAAKQYVDLDSLVGFQEKKLETQEKTMKILYAENEKLAQAYTDLKSAIAQRDAKKPKRSRLTTAIRDEARGPDGVIDPRLVTHLRKRAQQLRNQNVPEDKIIDQISTWQTTEDSDALNISNIVKHFDQDKTP